MINDYNMKQLKFIVCILISLVVLSGCENANITKLKREIKVANASCPINFGSAGDLLSIKYQENENRVLIYISLNEDIAGHVFLKHNKANMQRQVRLTMSGKAPRDLLDDIINAKASLMIIYKESSTGKTVKTALSFEELQEIKRDPLTDLEVNRMLIENNIAMQNAACPMPVAEGMKETKVAIVDNYLVYYIEMDEKMYDMKALKSDYGALKVSMQDGLNNLYNDLSGQRELQLLTLSGMDLIYRYYGNIGKEYVDVVFTSEELKRYDR